jgi:hypothetical protein
MKNRPDLLAEASLSEAEMAWIKQFDEHAISTDTEQMKVRLPE